FVLGCDSKGSSPLGSFPTFDSFLGEASTFQKPQAVYANEAPKTLTDHEIQGKEAVGALRFDEVTLKAGEEISYVIMMGIVESSDEAHAIFKKFNTLDQFEQALILTHKYWNDKAHAIDFRTGDSDFDAWMQWVTIQPVLRRIFGCSFLPDHDYGKGGKGWRDIWQDLLALILIEPATVRDVLINNFAGVRLDGSNATIIGARPGEFVADRNAITRVWMDHGAWPYSTTLLYVDQTGDFDILFERNTYFRDQQLSRSYKKDDTWNSAYGNDLKDTKGNVYEGTLLEHILVQHLVQFFNVGEHNIVRLESADWNDGLDMGFDRGESVTFASYYAGNLLSIAELLERLKEIKGTKTITLLKELSHLLDRVTGKAVDYSSIEDKKNRLFKDYCNSVQPEISGVTVDIEIDSLISDLKEKGQWLFKHIKEQEKISVDGDVWYNGYYDNKGMRVEGKKDGNVWMTLTGQVFPIMSGLATDDEVAQIIQSANKYLRDENLGGYRLNSDFGVRHYLDLGRAFGFAFGTKENGAFFSHMIVMYGYALYSRGFVRAGYEVLSSIYNMCMDVDKSQIYPGIPEYFDATGRGMYHYLTGSASWMVLAQQVQVFGVRGSGGDLVISPKLVKEQFSDEGIVSITSQFASKTIKVVYRNTDKLDYGAYGIDSVTLNGKAVDCEAIDKSSVKIARAIIKASSDTTEILVNLKSPEFN
ncbi:MAG: cellobiose phosphorylase, partial [Lysobacterales bacterium]